MKRIITFIISIFLFFYLFQFTINLFKTSHQIKYNFKKDEIEFRIFEKYNKKTGYYLEITNNDNTWIFNNSNDYNKQRHIIKDIKYINKEGIFCLLPIYLKDHDNDIICTKNNINYDYRALNNSIVSEFINNLKDDNILIEKENKEKIKYDMGLKIYENNLLDKDYISIWNYKGISVINKDKNQEIMVLEYDNYENTLGTLIDNYYFVPNYNDKYEYDSYFKINILDSSKKEFKFSNKINKDCYINGVVKNKLYIFDKSNKVQYYIDLINNNAHVTGNTTINAQFYDGKWSTRNIYDFVNEKIIFRKVIKDKIPISYQNILENDLAYYLYTASGDVYIVYKDKLTVKTLLFNNKNINNMQLINNTLYFICDDTLYYFMDGYGIRPVISKNEFKFNNKNIYSIYKK